MDAAITRSVDADPRPPTARDRRLTSGAGRLPQRRPRGAIACAGRCWRPPPPRPRRSKPRCPPRRPTARRRRRRCGAPRPPGAFDAHDVDALCSVLGWGSALMDFRRAGAGGGGTRIGFQEASWPLALDAVRLFTTPSSPWFVLASSFGPHHGQGALGPTNSSPVALLVLRRLLVEIPPKNGLSILTTTLLARILTRIRAITIAELILGIPRCPGLSGVGARSRERAQEGRAPRLDFVASSTLRCIAQSEFRKDFQATSRNADRPLEKLEGPG